MSGPRSDDAVPGLSPCANGDGGPAVDDFDLLPDVFARAVALHGDRIAIDVPPGPDRPLRRVVTYRELDQQAEHLARRLAARVGPRDAREGGAEPVVAVFLPRTSPALFAAQLAAWRVGAAFTCVDPKVPDAHARLVIEDARAVCVLADADGIRRLTAAGAPPAPTLDVDVADRSLREDGPRVPVGDRGRRLAYVIYTSGTTGRPKGVMIEHRSVASLVASDVDLFSLTPSARAAQGSQASYDSSIEETWLAFAVGATLVVMDDDAVRLGPDMPAWLARERITVFCPPPTMLRTMGLADPREALPDMALLYVGGEALTSDVADRWAPGRWLENGYGPTECTVTVLRTRVHAGEPVTIGRPVPGSRAYALGEAGDEMPVGQPGELCIAGLSLARGYLGQPALTAERFPTHPRLGRIYRTGDLVRQDADGAFHYLGRIDEQVKVRGHRVELGAVESALATIGSIREAACRVEESPTGAVLAAFVVAARPDAPPRWGDVEPLLRERVPAPMVPSRFTVLAALPKLSNGKLDRRSLPAANGVAHGLANGSANGAVKGSGGGITNGVAHLVGRAPAVPTSGVERRVADAFRAALGVADGVASDIAVGADFFLDLGGDSVAAAQAISLLRRDATTASLTVRDLYEARTARALALRAPAETERPGEPRALAALARDAHEAHETEALFSRSPAAPERRGRPALFTLVQSLWIVGEFALAGLALYAGALVAVPALVSRWGLVGTIFVAPLIALAVALAWIPLAVVLTAAAKRLLIGRYRPARAPVFGGLHLRHWIVGRVAALVPWGLVEDTVLLGAALRALGATIGRRVHLHREIDWRRGGWDLLSIGDEASIGQEASLAVTTLYDGHLVIGPVSVGARATVETRALLDPGTSMGDGATLSPLSWLRAGASIPAGEAWDGVPARRARGARPSASAARATDAKDAPIAHEWPPALHGLAVVAARFLRPSLHAAVVVACAALVAAAFGLSAARLTDAVLRPTSEPGLVVGMLLVAVLSVPLGALLSAIEVRCLGRVRPGVIGRFSVAYLRVLAKVHAVERAGNLLSGTMFWPAWLRLAGMRVGRKCEISTIIDVVPECVSIGNECFLADGIYLGGPRVVGGRVEIRATAIGDHSFVGNHAVLEAGSLLEDDVLVGVSTVAPAQAPGAACPARAAASASGTTSRMPAGTSWFGHPAFQMPRRTEPGVDRALTYDPTFSRFMTRLVWELARLVLPIPPLLALVAWLSIVDGASRASIGASPALFYGVVVPAVSIAVASALVLLVVAIKWTLLGRVEPGRHAFWSCWCMRWDFLYETWSAWARPFLASLEGTLLLACFLRAMGVKIGRRVALGPGFAHLVDPDMVEIGDDATVHALFQAHSFEDRMLKMDRIRIGRGASVAEGAVLFYGAVVGDGARVQPQSVVMKHETLSPGLAYAGCPTSAEPAVAIPSLALR